MSAREGAVHGALVAALSLAVAVEVGIPLGALTWRALARALVVMPRSDLPAGLLVDGLVGVLVATTALGLGAASRTTRAGLATALPAE